MRIIIIDDELLIVKATAAFLKQAGHEVVGQAGDLARGLTLIDESKFDLAIVDANLDGVSAEPLLRRLSERNIPVVLMSGYSAAQRPDWSGNVKFISKPFGPDDLMKPIEELVAVVPQA